MKFSTTIELNGRTATGMRVPEKVVTALGKGKRPPVSVTIRGYTYRSTVAVYGDAFFLPVSAEVREGSGVKAGDRVHVTVELDEAPRTVEVPADLKKALAKDAKARAAWSKLS